MFDWDEKIDWIRSVNTKTGENIIAGRMNGKEFYTMRLFDLKNGDLYSDEMIDEIVEIYKTAFNRGFSDGEKKKMNDIKSVIGL